MAYLRTKWHLDPSSRLDTTDMGRKLGVVPPFWVGELDPHLTQCGQGWGLPLCQLSSWSIQPFGHNTLTSQGRTDRQRSDSIGWTVLQTVAQKSRSFPRSLLQSAEESHSWSWTSLSNSVTRWIFPTGWHRKPDCWPLWEKKLPGVSQSRVASHFRCHGVCSSDCYRFTAVFWEKEFWQPVSVWQSYVQEHDGIFTARFLHHLVCTIIAGIILLVLLPPVLWCCLLGGRKGIRPVKNWVVGYWHVYLYLARCKWFACGPTDATATRSSLASLKPDWFNLSDASLPRLFRKRGH